MRQHKSVPPENPPSRSSELDRSTWTGAPSRRRRLATVLVAVAGGLALGIGLTVALTGAGDDETASRPEDPAPVTTATTKREGEEPQGAVAATPRAAVEGFLGAEIDGELTSSFDFLSADTRARFGSPAGWVAAHAEILAPIKGYEVQEVDEPSEGGDQVRVVTTVRFEPGLDEVRGLVAERAVVRWATANDSDGSWGVDLDGTSVEPLHPSDASAPAAVAAWAQAHQACQRAPVWDGNLKGSPALAERLCGVEGRIQVGPPSPLTSVDSGPFLAAFGPGAGDWARVVPVTAPLELRAVVAPIGQEWLVIGVLPA
ncbi:MAG: hypothetical protein M3N25_05590 [Actinomycetota bacterium]|nr:hypothetical protein [Actinomycetota bacterium]